MREELRICSPQLGLSPKSVLGGEVFDREVLKGLAKRGVKIDIILPKNKPHDRVKNWHFFYLKISHFPPRIFNILVLPALFRINSKYKIKLVRMHQPQFMSIGVFLFKLFNPKVKILATYHKFEETSFGPFSKYLNNYFDHIICDSITVKEKIISKFLVDPYKITVVHNGVPAYLKPRPKDARLRKKLNIKDQKVLLFMGLFIPRKNPLFLLNVVKKLKEKNLDVVLIYWGEGSLKNAIIKRAQEYKIKGNIRFQKPVFGKEKNTIHNLADVFVHPSLDEGFALAPLEAMACGKPVIMNNSHSASEAVKNGENGYICKTNNVDAWVNAIEKLLKNPELREIMGRKSLEKVNKEFSWKRTIDLHEKILNKLLK